jgi:hypothetical protein
MSKTEEAKKVWIDIISKDTEIYNRHSFEEIKTDLDIQFIVGDQIGMVYGLQCNTNKIHVIITGDDADVFFMNKPDSVSLFYFTNGIDGRCFRRFDDIFGIRVDKWEFTVMDVTEQEIINPGDEQKVDLFIFIDHSFFCTSSNKVQHVYNKFYAEK